MKLMLGDYITWEPTSAEVKLHQEGEEIVLSVVPLGRYKQKENRFSILKFGPSGITRYTNLPDWLELPLTSLGQVKIRGYDV